MAAKLPTAPGVGRPARGFTSNQAQKWVLAAAIVIAMTYTFRKLIEPGMTAAPAKGSTAHKLAGAGSPPPPLGQWAVAYGAGFTFLALMTVAAPELAASLAMLATAGSLLTNGTSIVADLAGLEGKTNSASVNAAANAFRQTPSAIGQAATAGVTSQAGGAAIAGAGAATGIGQAIG